MSATKPTNTMPWQISEAVLAFAGSAVAGTLWWAHRVHVSLPCTKDGGCQLVADSAQSHVSLLGMHIPVALLGLLAYLTALVIAMFKIASENGVTIRRSNALLCLLTGFGFVYSWYLQYIVYFVIGTFCVWCRASAIIMTVLFIVTAWEQIVLSGGRRHLDAGSESPTMSQVN